MNHTYTFFKVIKKVSHTHDQNASFIADVKLKSNSNPIFIQKIETHCTQRYKKLCEIAQMNETPFARISARASETKRYFSDLG